MKKLIALVALLSLTLAGIGCQHIAGVCDCAHPESSASQGAATNPYPVVGEKK
jgi:hypothetical protein